MIDHTSNQRALLRRVYHQYAITRYGYTLLAYIQGLAVVLFVFTNWKENHAASTAAWSFWVEAGGYAFNAWATAWLSAIMLASAHYVYVRRHGDEDARHQVLRLLNGFIYFPPFIAVIGYVPVYFLIGLAFELFSQLPGTAATAGEPA